MGSRITTAFVTTALLLTTACSGGDEDDEAVLDVGSDTESGAEDEDGEGGEGGGDVDARPADTAPDGPYVRDMPVPLEDGRFAETEFEVTAIERTGDSTALYMSITVDESAPPDGRYVDNFIDTPPGIIDPLSGRVYAGLVDDVDSSDPHFYTVLEDTNLPLDGDRDFGQPGDQVALRVYYPSLPEAVETVSTVFYNMGIMTGIPVTPVDSHRPLTDTAEAAGSDAGRLPDDDAEAATFDMQGFVEGPAGTTERTGDTETITLNADILFDFDEASLGPEAVEVLEGTAAAVEANGVPATDIGVVGHTDGVGDDTYNDDLSTERAEAVRDELTELLDADHSFDVAGQGSDEPVATEGGPDDEEARARNRRVEITYTVERRAETPEDATGDTINLAERHTAEPAPYRPAGEPVASESADGWQLDVYPLVRDGAYLMGEFELTNNTSETAEPDLGVAGDDVPDRYRDDLGNFRLYEPDTELTRYVTVVQTPDADQEYATASTQLPDLPPGESHRGVVIYPAPSPDVDQLDLQAGSFGEIAGIPIQ